MDGAIANNTPISHAIELGADRVIVLQAIRAGGLTRAPRGLVAAGLSAALHALSRRFVEDVDRYSSAAELTILPAPALEGILPSDFGHTDELIAEGLRGARAMLAGGGPVAAAGPRGLIGSGGATRHAQPVGQRVAHRGHLGGPGCSEVGTPVQLVKSR
jgi:predicted acylesterase/phospholipase RssA